MTDSFRRIEVNLLCPRKKKNISVFAGKPKIVHERRRQCSHKMYNTKDVVKACYDREGHAHPGPRPHSPRIRYTSCLVRISTACT